MKNRIFFLTTTLCIAYSSAQVTRDVWLWPCSRYSIWNMPIGSNAKYVPAQLEVPQKYAGDCAYFNRDTKAVPDAGDGENKIVTWFNADKINYQQSQNGRLWNGTRTDLYPGMVSIEQRATVQNIYGMGIEGAHYGSGLSGFAGNFRLGELINDVPIRHVLAIEISCWKYTHYDPSDLSWNINTGDFTKQGFRWPAVKHDSYAAGNYKGKVPAVRMGALFAIPPTVDINSLGLVTKAAKKIAWTLQNYGGYLVDDSYGSSSETIFNFGYHKGVNEEFKTAYGYDFDIRWNAGAPRQQPFFKDLDKIVVLLNVIDNNGPKSIGGGGNPRQCLAPPFSNGAPDLVASNPNGTVVEPVNCSWFVPTTNCRRESSNSAFVQEKVLQTRIVNILGQKVEGISNEEQLQKSMRRGSAHHVLIAMHRKEGGGLKIIRFVR